MPKAGDLQSIVLDSAEITEEKIFDAGVKVNRTFKDTVFRMLFKDKKNLLSLYNAVSKSRYTNEDDLQVVTLENAIYMGMKNDLSFILDMNLYLYEHQSTYNPNIPLRNLFYVSSEYQKLVADRSLYASTIQKIPEPKFVVFYNGTKNVADYREFRLSDAYEKASGDPDLELRVIMLNVNDGHNKELMEQCEMMREYSQYVARVRKYTASKAYTLEQAVERAVQECIEEGILAEFLMANRAEVVKMSIFEYDKEREEKLLRQAEYAAGVEDGLREGEARGIEIGKRDGIEIGKRDGIKIGRQKSLKDLVIKKTQKGLSAEEIAEMLEEDVSIIRQLMEGLELSDYHYDCNADNSL